jgi:hypothetical protein
MNRLFLLVAFVLTLGNLQAQKVVFYSDTLSFEVGNTVPLFTGKIEEKKDILGYYERLKAIGFLDEMSTQLLAIKKEYRLNDYFMAQILEKFCLMVAPKVSNRQQRVLMYSVLGFMGYDVRLASGTNGYHVLAKTDTELYDRSYLEFGKCKFYSIHAVGYKSNFTTTVDLIKVSDKVQFTFTLKDVPVFKTPKYNRKEVFFYHTYPVLYGEESESYVRGKIKEIKTDSSSAFIEFNQTLLDLYANVPSMRSEEYFQLGISENVKKQLYTLLDFSGQKTQADSLRYLISFVRTVGEYKEDKEAYKKERPMFPEEALFYRYSDCEDRNALLFYLVKDFLGLPMVVLEYPRHINIAVAIAGKYDQSVKSKGKVYYVCEASSGSAVVEIGESNAFDQHPHPKIIGEYHP